MSRERVIVIGGGMAGLAAARTLHDAGREVLLLEAKDHLGGRTRTSYDFAEVPVELGAEFIHGKRAVTWELVRALGLTTRLWDKENASMVRLEDGSWLRMAEARAADPAFDRTRRWDLPEVPAEAHEDWWSYLQRVGFAREQLQYVRRSYANACGESMRFLSARAMLEVVRDEDLGSGDFRIDEGYGAIVAALSRGLEVRTGTPVAAIDTGGSGVRITAATGERFAARMCVLAVPLGVLQSGAIHFAPELPKSKLRALRGLRMGPVIKLLFRFDRPLVAPDIMAIYSALNPPMWWSPSFGRDSDSQVWTAFASGGWAVALLARGEEGALRSALEALARELGVGVPEPVSAKLVNWPADPFTRGGYSFVLPGHHGARERLAEPTPPLFWAGEATEPERRSATVNGALHSGFRVAAEIERHLLGRDTVFAPAEGGAAERRAPEAGSDKSSH